MDWTVEITPQARTDIQQVFAFLFDTHHREFGRTTREASDLATARIDRILTQAERLAATPMVGTAHDDWRPGLRHVTVDRAIYWFFPDHQTRTVQIVAVFFGGQDHLRRMAERLGFDGGAA